MLMGCATGWGCIYTNGLTTMRLLLEFLEGGSTFSGFWWMRTSPGKQGFRNGKIRGLIVVTAIKESDLLGVRLF